MTVVTLTEAERNRVESLLRSAFAHETDGQHAKAHRLFDAALAVLRAAPVARDQEEARELLCQRCGCDYEVWFAPSEHWNAVIRGGDVSGREVYAFLCPTCFTIMANEAGIENTGWCVSPERWTEPSRDQEERQAALDVALRAAYRGGLEGDRPNDNALCLVCNVWSCGDEYNHAPHCPGRELEFNSESGFALARLGSVSGGKA